MITKEMLSDSIGDLAVDKICSIKADADSPETKQVTLRFNLQGVLLRAVIDSAISSAVIKWQNGPGRKQFTSWKTGQVIEVSFASPGKKTETREERIAKFEAVLGDKSLAVMAVDEPTKFQALVSKIKK
jgi:hypothetical protein